MVLCRRFNRGSLLSTHLLACFSSSFRFWRSYLPVLSVRKYLGNVPLFKKQKTCTVGAFHSTKYSGLTFRVFQATNRTVLPFSTVNDKHFSALLHAYNIQVCLDKLLRCRVNTCQILTAPPKAELSKFDVLALQNATV